MFSAMRHVIPGILRSQDRTKVSPNIGAAPRSARGGQATMVCSLTAVKIFVPGTIGHVTPSVCSVW
jgi:hypothetical protein